MGAFFTEADYENSVIELFKGLGYTYVYAPELERDLKSPLYEQELTNAIVCADGVVADGNIITASGAGVAVDFALELVRYLVSAETADAIRGGIQCR